MAASKRPPLSPREGWLSDGRQVLHFRPTRWTRHNQVLELTVGELIQGQAPLLKRRKEITREEAIKLWAQKRKAGWQVCPPQWTPTPEIKPPVRLPAASMGITGPRCWRQPEEVWINKPIEEPNPILELPLIQAA